MPKSPPVGDVRANSEPDYSMTVYVIDAPLPDAIYSEWAKLTSIHLDAPFPLGKQHYTEFLATHFHAPAEHTYYGKHMDIEMHIAYGDPTKPIKDAVSLTIMFDRLSGGNIENPFITTVLDARRTRDLEGDARLSADYSLLAKQLMGAEESFHAYKGSLDAGECDPDFSWIIPEMVLPISDLQLAAFAELSPENINAKNVNGGRGNNRATQPRDLNSYPVFHQPGMAKHHKQGDDHMHHEMKHGKSMMDGGCGMMEMMMGEMCMSATYIMAYAAPLAAAIAVAAF